VSLRKGKEWMQVHGRVDAAEGRTPRELEVLDRVLSIVLDLDGVVLHQGAKVGQGGEQHDLSFGRKKAERKTPIIFGGVLLRPTGTTWVRRSDAPETDVVRVYLKISEAAAAASDWADLIQEDDALKPDGEWRYLEIAERIDISGDELLDLIEDAYFAVVGI